MRIGMFFREALRSIRANAAISVAATVTALIAVFILGAFIPSFMYVRSAVDAQKSKVDVDVYISDTATVAQVNSLRGKLDGLRTDGTVASVTYVSKEDALRIMKERLRDPSVLDELPSNPLPAKFNVQPTEAENANVIVAAVKDDPALDPTEGIVYPETTADRLLTAAKFVQWAGFVLIGILLLAAVLLIGNTIRLSIFARRREVEVMRLVGATNWFIRWPFMIEGVICGLVGAVVAVAMLWGIKVGVVDAWASGADTALTKTGSAAGTIAFPLLTLVLVGAGALLGAVGSGITLRRFLKV
ncbi:MAG: permease-like cell division protein FtsX [Acidobacteria bacterium]|nr:permease-like cell division protein FtsX [Acidobacteriota bacterium]